MKTPAIGQKIYSLKYIRLSLTVSPGKERNPRAWNYVLIPEIAILKQPYPDDTHTG